MLYVNTLNNNAAALYEQIKRWVSKGKYTTTPIALINKLSLSDSYLSFPQMRRGYLAPTISSINKRTDLSVYIQEIRRNPANKNSKVVKLIFWIKRKNENKLISKESDL
ncbi:hypothetical protein [Psychromonas sp. KJ10-2]|uniref:hypothetical protein n=1 Tax=Psychromonas sp. KJ10-2 TaxID=3391822 RepID=UPI0039B4DDE7